MVVSDEEDDDGKDDNEMPKNDATSDTIGSDKVEDAGPSQHSESELSDVRDEPPPPKKKRQKGSSSTETQTAPKSKISKSNTSDNASPDEVEIKRLQGWLIKCGIRKLWGKELAAYDSPKAKIRHLKDMLKDAGMDGRYSEQKARSIKEQRELAADLEAVQEGNKQWGREGEDEEDSPERKRVASRFVDFGDDGEDESD